MALEEHAMYNIKISKASLDTTQIDLAEEIESLLYDGSALTVTLSDEKDNYGIVDGMSVVLSREIDVDATDICQDIYEIERINDRKFKFPFTEDTDVLVSTYGDDIIFIASARTFQFTINDYHDVDEVNVNIRKMKAFVGDGYYTFDLQNVETGVFGDYMRDDIPPAVKNSATMLYGIVSEAFTKSDGTTAATESDSVVLSKLLGASFKLCNGKYLNANKTDFLSGVTVTLQNTELKLSLPADAFQSPKLGHLEDIETMFVDRIMENRIPEVIDMEKRCVYPVLVSGETITDDCEILQINLHTRKRTEDDNWTVIEQGYWNNYPNTTVKTDALSADTLYDLGFKDADVKYRKKRLVNSFLRLSFYDSKNVLDQGLLFYSTVFMDATALLNEYNQYLATDDEDDPEDVVKQISSEIDIHNKYYTRKSSEGFYLYLFNDFLQSKMANDDMTIYMKVEYNHAGYGTTIPFVMFKDGYTHEGYISGDSANQSFLYSKYQDDAFIEIKVHYDRDKDRLEYYIPGARNHDLTISLDLYEPRIKGKYK